MNEVESQTNVDIHAHVSVDSVSVLEHMSSLKEKQREDMNICFSQQIIYELLETFYSNPQMCCMYIICHSGGIK